MDSTLENCHGRLKGHGHPRRIHDVYTNRLKIHYFKPRFTLIAKSWKTHSKIFSEISVFQVMSETDFWKTHPCEFHKYLSSVYYRSVSGPKIREIFLATKSSFLDEFSKNRSGSSPVSFTIGFKVRVLFFSYSL